VARTDVAAAANARVRQVVDYGLDTRGAGLFAALNRRAQHELNGATPVVDPDRARTFHGVTATPQRFLGLAPLGLARPVSPTSSTMPHERSASAVNDGALRIFAERLKRRR
jgi:hypothetical protein